MNQLIHDIHLVADKLAHGGDISSREDMENLVQKLQESWGGRGGDDLHIQMLAVVLGKACFNEICDEQFDLIAQGLED
jgi:hypothetical protein